MLQAIDNASEFTSDARRAWLALLSRAPLALLEEALAVHARQPVTWLRKPETGLYMLRGRIGGSGDKFNVGEATVTRCTLRVRASTDAAKERVGVAYIMGRSHRRAELAALADALLQDEALHAALQSQLLEPIARIENELTQSQARKAQATRVEFFTVAREANGASDQDADDEARAA